MLLVLLLLLIAVWIFIETPWGQNLIITQVTKHFSKELKTKVQIKHVDLSLFNRMHIEGVLVEDHQKDTLLYAGDIKVRITDWFFFKDKIELKYIGLDDAVIKLQRTDSTWNYQFLADYFSLSSSDTSSKGGVEINLKELELHNISLLQKDAWVGQDMSAKIGSLKLDAKEINFSSKKVNIASLDLGKPFFSIYQYDGNRPERPDSSSEAVSVPEKSDSTLQWNTGGWSLQVDKLTINDGRFKDDLQTDRAVLSYFDGAHIDFAKINGEFNNLQWIRDTLSAHLKLATKERSGFEVSSLIADARFHPKAMEFKNLDIITPKSHIRNYYAMRYDDFDDMNDYIHAVTMEGVFTDAEVSSDDIAYFAPELSTWKKNIRVNGNAKGTVDDITGHNMIVEAGKNTTLSGDISLTGLPDINQTFIDFKANDFHTTYGDAVTIIPSLKTVTTPNLQKLQYLNFTGNFTGFIHDFVTFGSLKTNLGTVKSDLNMKLPEGKDPIYSGNISTSNFNLGEFVNDKSLGSIAMDGVVKGKGFNEKTRLVNLDGKISYIDYNGYRYSNIIAKGKLDKKQFDGLASIKDENLVADLNGLVDFNGKQPRFDALANVEHANFKALGISKDSLDFNGKVNVNFTGSTIDNFLGTARITEASLTNNGVRLPFDTLILSADIIDSVKTLTAHSNEFDGSITGKFSIIDLPSAFELFLSKYYPSYINEPDKLVTNESFDFDITTRNVDDYTRLIDRNLSGFNDSHVSGSLNVNKNQLTLSADVPQFKYKEYNFDNINITGTGNRDSLVVLGNANNIHINDSLNIPSAIFKIRSAKDTSAVSIVTGANQGINKAYIAAQVITYDDGVKIAFEPSTFSINGKIWTVDKNGELTIRSKSGAAGELVLRESEQEIKLFTEPSSIGNWNDLNVSLKKVNIGDLSPLLLPHNRLEGLLSGTLKVEDPMGKLKVNGNIQGEFVRLDDDSIGAIESDLAYNNETSELTANGRNLDPDHQLSYNLNLFLDNKEREKENRIALKPVNYPFKILERFIGDLFSDLQGYITGNVDMTGPLEELNFSGKAKLHDAGLKVNFTQCYYKIDDTEIELKPNAIELGTFKVRDRFGKTATVTGRMEHTSFRNMFFDIEASIDNQPFELLNTTAKDNDQFYGKAKGTGSLSLIGKESDLYMKIDATASRTDSSSITILSSSSRENGIADYLVERKYGQEMSKVAGGSNATNITYDVDLNANPLVNITVVLDDLTGDEIRGHGEGSLNIRAGTTEPLTMRGRYNIQEGNYLFTFQSFFKKPFEVKGGTDNYIEWTGDPYKAKINLEARYKADKVSFAPLNNSLNLGSDYSNVREDVYVVADLTGELFKPTINFRLEFPPNSQANSDPGLAFNLQQIQKNPNELNKQVTYLIVFNSFAQVTNTFSASTIGEFAANTISGILSSEINKKLNDIFSKLVKNDNFHFNFSGSFYNRNPLDPNNKSGFNFDQGSFNVSVGQSFFNDRFILTFGSALDVPFSADNTTANQNYKVQFLPDVTAEWLINPSGTVRATFFYKENLDFLTGSTTTGAGRTKRSGASIAYKKDFDTLKELFQRNRPKKKKENKKETPSDETPNPATSSAKE